MRENHSLGATCLDPIHLRKFKSAAQYVYNGLSQFIRICC